MVCAYIETARAYAALGRHEDSCRCLGQCLSLQPNCTAALVALGKVEGMRNNTAAANRALEQALACDFRLGTVH